VKVLVIDNASTDETRDFLRAAEGVQVISNIENRGFAGACNQGIAASTDSDWRIFLNNDVLLPSEWLDGLLSAADQYGIDIISPAMREGPLNYDVAERATLLRQELGDHIRRNVAHGVCFAVRDRVFKSIGCFDESFRIGQYEEADFYRRARQAGFALATTGRSFIHHFSSVTQKAITSSSPSRHGEENQKYYRKKWRLDFRKLN
jgi:GT2 family glycosyltransferase